MTLNASRIADAESGTWYGARPLSEADGSGNTVNAQLIDIAHRKLPWALSYGETAEDSYTRLVTSSDSADIDPVPSVITSNALTCLDKNILNIFAHKNSEGTDDPGVTIVPIVLDSSDNPLGFLKPKYFTGYKPPGASNPLYIFDDVYYLVISAVEEWSIRGAVKIGLHVTLTETDHARIYAAMISGIQDDEHAISMPTKGTLTGTLSLGG